METLEALFDAFHKLPLWEDQQDLVEIGYDGYDGQRPHYYDEAPGSESVPEDVAAHIAWDGYHELERIRDITWEDVENLRKAARYAPDALQDRYIFYKEAFRALGFHYDKIIENSDAYIKQFGYPADMNQARLYELKQEYLGLRTHLIRDVLRYDPNHCRYIPTSPLCY